MRRLLPRLLLPLRSLRRPRDIVDIVTPGCEAACFGVPVIDIRPFGGEESGDRPRQPFG